MSPSGSYGIAYFYHALGKYLARCLILSRLDGGAETSSLGISVVPSRSFSSLD